MRTARRGTWLATAGLALLAVLGGRERSASAGTWDLNLSRLCVLETAANPGRFIDCGGGYDPAQLGDVANVYPDNAAFRSLMSELGVLFTPNILAPAETFGYNGYSFAVEFGFTTVNAKRNATQRIVDGQGNVLLDQDHRYWRAAESIDDAAFAGGNAHSTAAVERIERELPPTIGSTVTLMARKGLWLPLPSFELGVGVRHLIDSRMWAALVQAKLALHEGFQDLPLPAFAVRGTGSHVFGTRGFSLSAAGLDFSLSKHFGVAATFNLMPYVGYQLLWIIADSSVIDATPSIDAVAETARLFGGDTTECRVADCNASFTFDDQSNILRHRFFIGMRANLYLVSLLVEYSYFAAGRESDAVFDALSLRPAQVADESGAQHSVNFALSLDF